MFECVSDVGHMRLIRKLDDVEEVGAIHNEIDELGSTIKHPNRLTSAVSLPALDRYQRRVEYRASPFRQFQLFHTGHPASGVRSLNKQLPPRKSRL